MPLGPSEGQVDASNTFHPSSQVVDHSKQRPSRTTPSRRRAASGVVMIPATPPVGRRLADPPATQIAAGGGLDIWCSTSSYRLCVAMGSRDCRQRCGLAGQRWCEKRRGGGSRATPERRSVQSSPVLSSHSIPNKSESARRPPSSFLSGLSLLWNSYSLALLPCSELS